MKRTFTTILTAALLGGAFGATADAAPKATDGSRVSRLTAGSELTIGGKTFRVDSPKGLRHKGPRRVVGPDIITDPNGTPQEYSKNSAGYYFYGNYNAYQDADQAATIYWDGNEAYIYNILSYKETYSYVKGTREGDYLTVELNQTVAADEDFDIKLGLLRTMLAVAPNPDWKPGDDEDEQYLNYIYFDYDKDLSEVKYSIGADGELKLLLPEAPKSDGQFGVPDENGIIYLDPAANGFPDYGLGFYYTDDLGWTGDCDIRQEYFEFNYDRVLMPEGLEFSYFSYVNANDVGVLVYVARIDDTLYIKGLSAYAPDAVFKANLMQTEKGLIASIPQKQFIGTSEDGYYNLLTRTAQYRSGNYILAPDNVDATFDVLVDPETGVITSMVTNASSNILVFNYASDYYDPYDEFPGLNLRYQATLDGTPQPPGKPYFEDHSAWLGANYLFFFFYEFTEEGNILDIDALYYRVFVNGEPYSFGEHTGTSLNGSFTTMYAGLTPATTLVPFTFYNGYDLFYDEYHLYYVGFYQTDIESLAVQTVYMRGDEPTYSEIVNVDVSKVEAVAGENVVATDYYTLDGRRIENPDRGIYIRIDRFENGSSKATKVVL